MKIARITKDKATVRSNKEAARLIIPFGKPINLGG